MSESNKAGSRCMPAKPERQRSNVVAISVSPKLALMVGTYFLVLHQLEANILVPKIMKRSGGALWGLVGAILAIPTAALLSVIIEEIAAEQDARVQRIK